MGAQITAADVQWARGIAARAALRFPALEVDEAVSAALLALVAAAARWRPGKGATLRTYARPRVIGAVLDAWEQLPGVSRSEAHRASFAPLDEEKNGGEVDGGQEAVVQAGELRRAVQRLDRKRRALVMGVLKGGDQGKIGIRLGRNRTWACRAMRRCIDDLRDEMGVAA